MTSALADELERPRVTRAVKWLIAINVAIYYLQLTLVPANSMQSALGFAPENLWASWWTIGTFMFVNGGFWNLAVNMYALWLFGPKLENAWSAGEFTRYYLLCGLGGWFFHFLFAHDALLVGSSASVLGVMLAYAVRWPSDEVYLFSFVPVKVKWLVAMLSGVILVAGVASGGQGGGVQYFAQVGGLAAGWLLLRSSTAASIDRFRQRVSQLPDLPDETPRVVPRSIPRARERGQAGQSGSGRDIDSIVARSNAAVSRRSVPAQPASGKRPQQQRQIDLNLVLDKISQHGLESLTSEERKLLEDLSRELRAED